MIAYFFAVIFALIFIALTILIHNYDFERYDLKISQWAIAHRTPNATKFFLFFTELGKFGPAFLILALLYISPATAPNIALPVTVTAALGSTITFIIKGIVKRARPIGHRLVEEKDHSFPSAHAVGAADIYLGIAVNSIYLISPSASWLIIPAIVIMACIGASRVYLGIHHPSDVAAGWALGSFLVIVMALIFKSF